MADHDIFGQVALANPIAQILVLTAAIAFLLYEAGRDTRVAPYFARLRGWIEDAAFFLVIACLFVIGFVLTIIWLIVAGLCGVAELFGLGCKNSRKRLSDSAGDRTMNPSAYSGTEAE